jgi:hypothetical protein
VAEKRSWAASCLEGERLRDDPGVEVARAVSGGVEDQARSVVRVEALMEEDGMIRRRLFFTAAGSLALAVGVGLPDWMDGNFTHFASGFLLGASIALLILGLARLSRRVSR